MSQPSSSIVSADNAQLKYKKALKEISKLISANRVLRDNADKSNHELKQKIDELSLRYEDLEKEYDMVRKEKESFAHYLDEIQKERNNLQRQNAYLSDCLSEQTAELKKLQLHKDQKAMANLIRTYEEKELVMKRNRTQNEEMMGKLKETVERLESQIEQQRKQRQDYEDRYNNLMLELSKYKQMNTTLMSQNQRLLLESNHKDSYCIEKEKQLDILVNQFKSQISLLQTNKVQASHLQNDRYVENYEYVLQEKTKLQTDFARLQDAYEEALNREKEYYQIQEKMKSANIRAERAIEEANMLKNKIVVLEAKEFLDEAGDDDYDQKEFEERLNLLLAQNDPLASLKNGEDTSHFRILKSFIVDLQEKIYKIGSDKKEISRKYKSMKSKFAKNLQQLKFYEEQNKLMKGKIEGYQRLSEKLHFQLQKTLSQNEEQITRMTITSNNILTMKSEEYKATINVLNSQLEMTQDKADRTQKNMKQQIETLKLELEAIKIKYKDEEVTFRKQSQMIEFYKKEMNEKSGKISQLEEDLLEANQTSNTFQQLYKEEKGKNQGLTVQKQHLIAQNKQLTEQLDRKSYQFNENARSKQDDYEYELKRLKNENVRLKEEIEYMAKEMKNMKRELEEKRYSDQTEMQELKRLNNKNMELEDKLSEAKRKIRQINDETDTLKIKAKKYQDNYEKYQRLEEEMILKTDQVNDLLRSKLMLQSDLKNLEAHLAEQKKISSQLQKEISSNKIKTLESTHDVKKEFESKILDNKRNIQSLNQEISDLTSQLREEKSKNLRLNNDANNLKAEKARMEDILEQNRKKDFQIENQLGNLKLQLSSAGMEIQKLKNQVKSEQANSNALNQEIENMQQKIYSLNQEISSLKMKLENSDDEKTDLARDLNSMKYNFSTVEGHLLKLKSTINQSWEEQNFTNSLSDIMMKVKKIARNYSVSFDSSVQMIESHGSAGGRSNKDNYSYYKSYAQENSSSRIKIENSRTMMGMNNISMDLKEASNYSGHQYSSSNRNFDYSIHTTESIKNPTGTQIEYTYSDSNVGSLKGIDKQWGNNQPSYTGNYQEINYNFSEDVNDSKYGNYRVEA